MKSLRLFTGTILTAVGMVAAPALAASSWNAVGLSNQKINKILPMTGFGGNALMVGTDKGVWWYQDGDWDTAWTGLPVHDLALTSSGEPVAVAGNGSDSDGVYLGKITGIAKKAVGGDGMNTWWGFSLQQRHHLPTALAIQRPLDSNCGSVFVGNSTGVASGLLCNGAVGALTTLAGPQWPFGTWCASMIVYSVDGRLYAGGNNEDRMASIMAHGDTSWLVRGTTELTRFRQLSVTSLIEFKTERDILINGSAIIGEQPIRGTVLLAAATVDSGIKLFEGDYFYGELPPPVRGEPVVAIASFSKVQTFKGFTLTMLAAATPSGVYRQCSPDADCQWTKIDGLPHRPTCLAQINGSVLWAGTDSGLYQYALPTAAGVAAFSSVSPAVRVSAVTPGKGSIRFDVRGGGDATRSIRLFDMRGKCVRREMVTGGGATFDGLVGGCYVYRLVSGGRVVASGNVVCR